MHNGRMLWEVNRQKSLVERAAELLGREAVRDMLCLEQQGPEGMRLHGLISSPRLNRSGLGGMFTFINGRFIRDKVVQHALADGYRNLLAKGRHPVLVLFLEIDPSQVDVNVHPTKHEVRFRQQALVHDFIVKALRDHLQEVPTSAMPASQDSPFTVPASENAASVKLDEPKPSFTDTPAAFPVEESSSRSDTPCPPALNVADTVDSYVAHNGVLESSTTEPRLSEEGLFSIKSDLRPAEQNESSGFFASLRLIGQYQNSYLVCQSDKDLILIDQHAAHERIGFEHLKKQYLAGSVERQLLLFPLVLEFDFRQGRIVEQQRDSLFRLGFALENFGGNAFALKELPRMLKEADAERLVRDVIEEFAAIGRSQAVEIELERILLKMACHAMVRAHQRLSFDEMQALLDELDKTPFSSNCPHGRPTYLRWSLGELERLFKRA